jgi:hypothetical protein
MKKIQNKSLAMALLRGAVALSGLMATMCFALFCESWNSLFAVSLAGLTITVLLDETIKAKYHVL